MSYLSSTTALGMVFLGASLLATTAQANGHGNHEKPEAATLQEALTEGDVNIEARYRFEFVDQDGFDNDATASTLRTKLGYTTGTFKGFTGKLEFENVSVIGNDRTFNDTENGVTDRPVVADPEVTNVNQVYIAYSDIPDTNIKVGRQAINLNNKRFISTLNWRQNDRTFDAASITNTSIPGLELFYSYAGRVSQSLPSAVNNFEGDTHIVNAKYTGLKDQIGTFTAYNYSLDFDSVAASNRSSNTFGVSLKGSKDIGDVKFDYYGEYARQSDNGDNPISYDADYIQIKPTLNWNNWSASVSYELLGSDNGRGIDTPFGLLHAFNGLADIFINTPASGLEDLNFSLAYTTQNDNPWLDKWKFKGKYHDFSSDEGSEDFGTEIDLTVAKKISKNLDASLTYADFNSDGFAQDTKKVYLILSYKY